MLNIFTHFNYYQFSKGGFCMDGSVKKRKLKSGKVVYDITVDLPKRSDGSKTT